MGPRIAPHTRLSKTVYLAFITVSIPLGGDAIARASEQSSQEKALFSAPVMYPVGRLPQGVAASDLNGDDYPDVLAVNDLDGDVSILLNAGDGTFLPESRVSVGLRPSKADMADLDGDGDIDAAVLNKLESTMSVLLNDGNGLLTEVARYPTGALPTDIELVDVNSDNAIDAIIANLGTGVSLLLNSGNGAFPELTILNSGSMTTSVCIEDIEGDGDLDILASSAGLIALSLFIGDGAGNFDEPIFLPSINTASVSIMTDLNGDGLAEIVSNGGDVSNQGNSIAVWTQFSSLQFTSPRSFAVGGISEMTAADFDLDGVMDLVGEGELNSIVVVWGDPHGTYSGWQNLIPDGPGGAGRATINGFDLSELLLQWDTSNASADLLPDNLVNGRDLATLLAHWGPIEEYRPPATLPLNVPSAQHCVIDVDLDGDLDIVRAGGNSESGFLVVIQSLANRR